MPQLQQRSWSLQSLRVRCSCTSWIWQLMLIRLPSWRNWPLITTPKIHYLTAYLRLGADGNAANRQLVRHYLDICIKGAPQTLD